MLLLIQDLYSNRSTQAEKASRRTRPCNGSSTPRSGEATANDAGMLPHRITVNQLVETQDGLNQPIQTWIAIGIYWGLYKNLTGRELMVAKQIRARASGSVLFRNLPLAITEQLASASTAT